MQRIVRLATLSTLTVVFLLCARRLGAQSFRVAPHRFAPRNFGFVYLGVTDSPGSVSFTLTPGGTSTASSSIAITTTWVGGLGFTGSLILYGYFSSATAALSGGTPVSNIPSSDVFGQVPTGTPTSYTAFTQTTPYSGASGLQLYSITSVAVLGGNRTDNLSLKINLSSIPQLPAATYTGVLYLEAQSF
jgi:hypothetical protein